MGRLAGPPPDPVLADRVGPRQVGRRRRERVELARSLGIALVSTVVVFGGLAWLIVNSPGWPAVQRSFLDGPSSPKALPDVVGAFRATSQLFLIAEVLILAVRTAAGRPAQRCPDQRSSRCASWRPSTRTSSGRSPAWSSSSRSASAVPGLGVVGRAASSPFFWARGRADPGLLGVRLGGLSAPASNPSIRARRPRLARSV